MAKRVFFSFHYNDVIDFRANVVRNHWLTKPDREICGYYDASIWEEAKKQGDIALKRLINNGLKQTSNTCVLIGSGTYLRPWVRYEILKSFKKGNHLFGVHINSIKSKSQETKKKGPNPFEYVGVTFSDSGKTVTLWEKSMGNGLNMTRLMDLPLISWIPLLNKKCEVMDTILAIFIVYIVGSMIVVIKTFPTG